MNIKPILFSTPMVQAIIAGRKSQTRRLIKVTDIISDPCAFRYVGNSNDIDIPRPAIKYDNRIYYQFELRNNNEPAWITTAKYEVDDILWVRETWGELYDTCDHDELPGCPQERWTNGYVYRASDTVENREGRLYINGKIEQSFINYWKPSIFMPKEAARVFLKVTRVRAERLQDISQEDSKAEGVVKMPHRCEGWANPLDNFKDCYRCAFKVLWNQINGEKINWDANPWVWCYDFERIDKPKNFLV